MVGQAVNVAPMVDIGPLAQSPLTKPMGAQPAHQGRFFRVVDFRKTTDGEQQFTSNSEHAHTEAAIDMDQLPGPTGTRYQWITHHAHRRDPQIDLRRRIDRSAVTCQMIRLELIIAVEKHHPGRTRMLDHPVAATRLSPVGMTPAGDPMITAAPVAQRRPGAIDRSVVGDQQLPRLFGPRPYRGTTRSSNRARLQVGNKIENSGALMLGY